MDFFVVVDNGEGVGVYGDIEGVGVWGDRGCGSMGAEMGLWAMQSSRDEYCLSLTGHQPAGGM